MFPSQSVAMRFHTIDEVKDHYQLRPEIWNSFVTVAGDPGQDLRLLASLPTNVVGAALAGARLNGTTPLSAVQASHVGLVWSLAKRIMRTRSGGARLGLLGPCYTFPGVQQRDEGTTSGCLTFTSSIHSFGKEGEDEPSLGSKRRLRSLGRDGGHEGFVVSKIPYFYRRMAVRRRRTNHGTDIRLSEASQDPEHSSICGLRSMGPLRPEGFEGFEISNLYPDIFRIYNKRAARSFELCSMESLLPGAEVCADHARLRIVGRAALLRDDDGKVDASLPHLLAFDLCSGRVGKVSPLKQNKVKNRHGHQEWPEGSHELGRTSPMGLCLQPALCRRSILADPSTHPSSSLDGSREQGHTKNTSGDPRLGIHAGRTFSHCPSCGPEVEPPGKTNLPYGDTDKDSKGGQKEKGKGRQGGAPKVQAGRSQEGQEGGPEGWQTTLLWLEHNGNGPCADLQPGQQCVSATPREHRCTICQSPGHPSRSCPTKSQKK